MASKPRLLSLFPGWLSFWVPIVTALISLGISLYTFLVATSDPEVLLVMPEVVRIAQGRENRAYLYLQPIFIGTGQSERIDVITGLSFEVMALDRNADDVVFVWDEQGSWLFDAQAQNLNWIYAADAGAFLVSAKHAHDVTNLFIGPGDWLFEAGTYRITLLAERMTAAQPLAESVEIVFTPDNVTYLNEAAGTRFLTFPVRK